MATVIEGFAIETTDDLIFTVKGLLHPPRRVIAYLRYLPDPAGSRTRYGRRYRRIYRFDDQEAVLRARHPTYIAEDPVFGLPLQSVPRRRFRTVYDPRRYLAALRESCRCDSLEGDALILVALLQHTANVPWANLGISGSLMLGLQRRSSDLDLIVYGESAGRNVHRALRSLLDRTAVELRRPNAEELAALHAAHRPDTPLSFRQFAWLQSRKVNELRFRGRETFVRFVKLPNDVEERYGDRRFEPLESAEIRARVIDDRNAIFTPCRYAVADAMMADGSPLTDLREIVSFRGRFSDQIRAGEWAAARGRLELVLKRERPRYRRLTVGGETGDYLLQSEDDLHREQQDP